MDRIVRRRRTILRPPYQRTPKRPPGRRWSLEEDALQCAISEEIVVFECHHGWSPQPSPLAPRKVVTTATDRASRTWGRHNRSRLRLMRPPPVTSRAATRQCRLGPPLVPHDVAHRSHLVPQEVVVDVWPPLATARTSRGCSHHLASKP
jgi:hypothetical protein